MKARGENRRMRLTLSVFICHLALAGVAAAQTRSTSTQSPSKGYIEAVAQSAFGNVTSQSFGAELGVRIAPDLHVFVEAGQVRDTSPALLGQNAQLIAGFLSQTQAGASYTVKQPVTFGVAGLRYGRAIGSVEPYVLGGAGVGRVKRDVAFRVGGTDVTSNLQTQYGVTLGSDLSGDETKAMITLGGGVAWGPWQRLVIDLQYRYGRVMTSDEGLNVSRAGIGLGVRF